MARDLGNPFEKLTTQTAQEVADDWYGLPAAPPAPPPDNALVPQTDGTITYKRFVMRPTGLDIPADVTEREWEDIGLIIQRLETSVQWLIGDWAAYANAVWGYTYDDIAEAFGYEKATVKSYASVARNVGALLRVNSLTFTHHRLVAKLPEIAQSQWLEEAAANDWPVAELRRQMNRNSTKTPDNDPFSRKRAPKVRRMQRLFVAIGQGDRSKIDDLRNELNRLRGWIADVENQIG